MKRPASRLASIAILYAIPLLLATGCGTGSPAPVPRPVAGSGSDSIALYDPSIDLGSLFQSVQLAGIFTDSKTFADARPLGPPAEIVAAYHHERGHPGFDLSSFVQQRFELPSTTATGLGPDSARTMEEHIRGLWPLLTRAPPSDLRPPTSSLIPLPNRYVVPGGRFREIYYWDSYFTMLGLVASGQTDLARSMLDNFAWMISRLGHIPNGNRTYYLSRSQPPFFAAMVGLYARATDSAQALRYLPALEGEHAFWMNGAERLGSDQAYRRVVRMGNGSVLNRYWDDRPSPRPESYREDFEQGLKLPEARREDFFRNVRATAESGWDFSSRWMRNPRDLLTLETTSLVPVDLNSLLCYQEELIAALRRLRAHQGDSVVGERFSAAAAERRRNLLAASFDSVSGYFYDVRWRTGERVTDRPTLAGVVPLYLGLASAAQGRVVAERLERDFLRPGGFVTSLISSGQQWDAPNGWAPLEWMAIEGARRYGRADLADTAGERWLGLNRHTWQATGRMMEKYDVVDLTRPAGGGEYPTQDGFGWTNGVAIVLSDSLEGHRHW